MPESTTRKPLTHTRQADTAKPESRPYTLSVGSGLALEVPPNGAKRWRYRYSFNGKRGLLSLGIYPAVGLADAKTARNDLNRLITQGIDPIEQRKTEKQTAQQQDCDTFAHIARQWLSDQEAAVKPTTQTRSRSRRMLENDLIPMIGDRPIRSRLIVSVPVSVVGEIDQLTRKRYPRPERHNLHPAFGNRSEFVRLAIVEKLERDQMTIDAMQA